MSGFEWRVAQSAYVMRRSMFASRRLDGRAVDEYGAETFATQCEQAVVNEHERSGTFPVNTKRFRNLRELCEEMTSLKDTFKVYTFLPSLFEQLQYSALSWTPTFNRGYDVERQLVRSFSRGPFTTRDPNQATAFFVPVMPYLDRVSGFPSNGRANMRARFNAFVESRKKTRLWREIDCKRFAATVHDYGTNFALDQPHALKTTTFVSSNAEWIARDGVTGQVSGEPYSVENMSRACARPLTIYRQRRSSTECLARILDFAGEHSCPSKAACLARSGGASPRSSRRRTQESIYHLAVTCLRMRTWKSSRRQSSVYT